MGSTLASKKWVTKIKNHIYQHENEKGKPSIKQRQKDKPIKLQTFKRYLHRQRSTQTKRKRDRHTRHRAQENMYGIGVRKKYLYDRMTTMYMKNNYAKM